MALKAVRGLHPCPMEEASATRDAPVLFWFSTRVHMCTHIYRDTNTHRLTYSHMHISREMHICDTDINTHTITDIQHNPPIPIHFIPIFCTPHPHNEALLGSRAPGPTSCVPLGQALTSLTVSFLIWSIGRAVPAELISGLSKVVHGNGLREL
jgi:hypothetical protein